MLVRSGSTVTVTVQLTDGTNPVAKSGVSVIFTHQRYSDSAETTLISQTATTVKTGATGAATFAVTYADPTAGDDAAVYDDVDVSIVAPAFTGSVDLVWSDDAAVAKTLKLALGSAYVVSTTTATDSATATAYDQYGSGLANQPVAFTGAAGSLGTTAVNRITNSSGAASVAWTHTSGANEAETITATLGALVPTKTVYWVKAAAVGNYSVANTVLAADTANNKVVFQDVAGTVEAAGTYVVATYKDTDQFNSPTGTPILVAAFEKILDDTTADTITVNYTATTSTWTRP